MRAPSTPPAGFTRFECALLWLAGLCLLAATVLLSCYARALQHCH